jgi:hypothetical protein
MRLIPHEKGLIPHRSARGPLPRNLGAFCGQIAPMVAVLPVVPVRKYCAVYHLGERPYHGMEEVIGSIPIRSTNQFNNLRDLQNRSRVHKGPIREFPLFRLRRQPAACQLLLTVPCAWPE